MFRMFAALLVCTVLWPFSTLEAQTQNRRPIVGLALSGGSALGLAHIGVLRYLEEHRIPVDRIAGTSMGGLLGGLYATGHDAAALEKIVNEADWDDLLRTSPKFEDLSVSEKQEWNRVTGQYSIRFGNAFSLPAGINPGRSLGLLLSGETAAYSGVRNFDDLPIPFRCVATDLVSGEAYVLREGNLPKALRATMAIPGIFTPVNWDNRILSDGGLVNNLPTDVVKAMGAGVIIGVTLRIAPGGADELRSMLDILRQSTNVAVVQNELRNVPIADIEIMVPLGNRASMDFSDTKSIIESGYNAAAQNQSALEKLSLPPDQWEQYLQARKARERRMPAYGPIVEVSAPEPGIQRNATVELLRKSGPEISRKRLEENLSGLMAATGLPNAFYGWRDTPPERSGFQIQLEPRRTAEIVMSPSLFFQLSPDEPDRLTLRLSGAAVPETAYKSRFLGEVKLGESPAISVEYYHPFDGSAYFMAAGFSIERNRYFSYDGNDHTNETRDRFSGSFFAGIGTWRHLQIRAGARAGLDKYSSSKSESGPPATNGGFVNPEITGIINTQDSGQMPSRGVRLNGSAGWNLQSRSFPYVHASFDHFQPVRGSTSLFAIGQLDSSMGRRLTFYDRFSAGGLTNLDAYRYQELRADTILAAGGGILYRGANPKGALFRPILGVWYEAARLKPVDGSATTKHSAATGFFMPTPLGLAGLTVSLDMKGSTRFRFSIGSFWNRP